ncbi:hypothetical protein F4823DRAFT_589976 [Ustulina deusta]|nr:hypothetical protein F4823DRAFT_589976 [Ustulina deusta]
MLFWASFSSLISLIESSLIFILLEESKMGVGTIQACMRACRLITGLLPLKGLKGFRELDSAADPTYPLAIVTEVHVEPIAKLLRPSSVLRHFRMIRNMTSSI